MEISHTYEGDGRHIIRRIATQIQKNGCFLIVGSGETYARVRTEKGF